MFQRSFSTAHALVDAQVLFLFLGISDRYNNISSGLTGLQCLFRKDCMLSMFLYVSPCLQFYRSHAPHAGDRALLFITQKVEHDSLP